MKIKNPNNLPLIELNQIKTTQGGFKDLTEFCYDELLFQIKKDGFIFPFVLWQVKEDETVFIDGERTEIKKGEFRLIDGEQRARILKNEGHGSKLFPYYIIEAENFKDAKLKLAAFTSNYGKITKDGYDLFTFDFTEEEKDEFELGMWDFKELEEEDDLEQEDIIKSQPKITIKFENVDDLQSAESELQEVIDRVCTGAYMEVKL